MDTLLERPKIKICGITNKEDARVVSSSGADYIGFICFEESKRYVTPEQILEISEELYENVEKVGVFVNASISEIKEVYEKSNLDVIQLHGEETENFAHSLNLPYIKAIRVRELSDIAIIEEYKGDPNCRGILLDAFSSKDFGGTGIRVERNIIDQALIICSRNKLNLLIAGGISQQNLKEFYSLWKNIYAFDISSSVEVKPGLKDPTKIYQLFDEYHRIHSSS